MNGGDVGPFPRKEKVRHWTHAEKTLGGIAGGTLRFRTWSKGASRVAPAIYVPDPNVGPASQLSLLVKADKEAKELMAKKAKVTPAGSATPSERPLFHTALSTESLPTLARASVSNQEPSQGVEDALGEADDADETASVMSAREGSVPQAASPAPASTSTASLPVVPAKRKAPGLKSMKPKAAPRKSKLAQEIRPPSEAGDATSAIEDIL
jgi:hypothetical protein